MPRLCLPNETKLYDLQIGVRPAGPPFMSTNWMIWLIIRKTRKSFHLLREEQWLNFVCSGQTGIRFRAVSILLVLLTLLALMLPEFALMLFSFPSSVGNNSPLVSRPFVNPPSGADNHTIGTSSTTLNRQ